MNKNYSKLLFGAFMISILFSSCSSTNNLTLSVLEPAKVYMPSEIETIGIIDRSLPSKGNENLDKLEKILSLEGQNLDKEAAEQSVIGLYDELLKNNRFSEVKIIKSTDVKNPGSGAFPSPISWNDVDRICNENNVNGIFELSFYDTDTRVDYRTIPIEVIGPLGIKIPGIEHQANVQTLIKTGWRIYDRTNKLILDEYIANENLQLTGTGINPAKAIQAIVNRKEAVLQFSNNLGHEYAFRIIPYNIRVSRKYFVKGTNNFEIAKRRAQSGDWDGAAELWHKETTNSNSKIAGRAYYNMGIINEINGDLNAAVEWTSKSYTDYNNKIALKYLNILKYRIKRNNQLQEQMK